MRILFLIFCSTIDLSVSSLGLFTNGFLGFTVRVSLSYWDIITQIKHPIMTGREEDVQTTLTQPDEIRQSRSDPNVYLFYKLQQEKRWICAVAKRLNGDGFLITCYPADVIKEGEIIWQK